MIGKFGDAHKNVLLGICIVLILLMVWGHIASLSSVYRTVETQDALSVIKYKDGFEGRDSDMRTAQSDTGKGFFSGGADTRFATHVGFGNDNFLGSMERPIFYAGGDLARAKRMMRTSDKLGQAYAALEAEEALEGYSARKQNPNRGNSLDGIGVADLDLDQALHGR